MKQIFDWLREQIQDKIIRKGCPSIDCWTRTSRDCDKCNLKSLQVREVFDIINEAEAKWETEHCTECENCGTKVEKDSNGDYVCGLCGRDTARLRELEQEEEVCEWKPTTYSMIDGKEYGYKTDCGNGHICGKFKNIPSHYKYCHYCGKPIKISEVE